MVNKKISIAIDCDDVLFSCIPYAIERYNKREGTNIKEDQIIGWGKTIGNADVVFKEWETADFFEKQPVIEGAKSFIKELSKYCDIYIATAIDYRFMAIRMRRIMEEFPEINPSNILMGTSKNKIKTDFLLDDGFHNIRESIADFPVLFRRPWNSDATGILAINNYDEFLTLIKEIQYDKIPHKICKNNEGKIIALIGPSGTRKNEIVSQMVANNSKLTKIKTYTTNSNDVNREFITKEEFLEKKKENIFFEYTVYAGHYYASMKEDIKEELEKGNDVILPMDIGGILSLKTNFSNVLSIYINRNREDILLDVIKRDIPDNEKVKRIISLDVEKRNRQLCDYVVDGNKKITDIINDINNIVQNTY